MVIIRIGMDKLTLSQVSTVRGGITSDTVRGSVSQYSMKPVQVHVSHSTHTDRTSVYGVWNQNRPPTRKESLYEATSDVLSA